MFNSYKKPYHNISAAEFRSKMNEKNTLILDVRTAAEIAERIIPGAVTGLDFYNGEFESAYQSLDKSKTYLIYCRSGVRSAHACEMMAAEGFESLYNLRGGILEWVDLEE